MRSESFKRRFATLLVAGLAAVACNGLTSSSNAPSGGSGGAGGGSDAMPRGDARSDETALAPDGAPEVGDSGADSGSGCDAVKCSAACQKACKSMYGVGSCRKDGTCDCQCLG